MTDQSDFPQSDSTRGDCTSTGARIQSREEALHFDTGTDAGSDTDTGTDTGTPDIATDTATLHGAPEVIYQSFLDAFGALFWQRKWPEMETFIELPAHVSATDTSRVFEDFDSWVRARKLNRDVLDEMGVSEYHRICRTARFAAPAEGASGKRLRVLGEHETYFMQGGQLMMDPLRSQLTLVHLDGNWRSAGIHSALREADLSLVYPESRSGPLSP